MKNIALHIGKYFYQNHIYLTITWSILMFLMFIKINYYSCLDKLKLVTSIEHVFLFFMLLFLISGMFFLLFSRSIQKNERAIIDKENSEFVQTIRNQDEIKINILPLFYVWVFSSSKIIVILYDFFYKNKNIDLTNYFLMIWIAFFGFSLYYWCKFKYKSSETYSVPYVIFILLYTLGVVFWQELIPYVKNILLLKNCITNEILNG